MTPQERKKKTRERLAAIAKLVASINTKSPDVKMIIRPLHASSNVWIEWDETEQLRPKSLAEAVYFLEGFLESASRWPAPICPGCSKFIYYDHVQGCWEHLRSRLPLCTA